MICGERAIPMPEPNPDTLLAGPGAHALRVLHDDLLMDALLSFARKPPANRDDAIFCDVVRAEFSRRHRPAALELVR